MPKLVRVRPEVIEKAPRNSRDIEAIEEHGYLWFLYEVGATDQLKHYRSLATGYIHPWFDHEVEEMPDE
jgi:hypothetical protein